MLINFSNHPYSQWSDKQKSAAAVYGECIDIPFPAVAPHLSESEIDCLAETYLNRIVETANAEGTLAVHIMGEFTLTYSLIQKLKAKNIVCIASCAQRNVSETSDGVKHVIFDFVRFRKF